MIPRNREDSEDIRIGLKRLRDYLKTPRQVISYESYSKKRRIRSKKKKA